MDKTILNLLQDADKRQRLKRLIEDFEALDGSARPVVRLKGTNKPQRKPPSAATRQRMSKAAKRRWSVRKAKEKSAVAKKKPARKTITKKSSKKVPEPQQGA